MIQESLLLFPGRMVERVPEICNLFRVSNMSQT